MSIVIKSTQIYENSTEEIIERQENEIVETTDESVGIYYNGDYILVDLKNYTASIKHGANEIFIKINEKTLLKYETEYGKIQMEVVGQKISAQLNPINIVIEYQIKMNDTLQYQNIVEITGE